MPADMTAFEDAVNATISHAEIARRVIRLLELSTKMFEAIYTEAEDEAADIPESILLAADDWYSFLSESSLGSV